MPFKIQYRYRPQEYGDQLVRMYLLTNDKESKLGTTPLPDGIVRVFRDNGRDGLSYLDAAVDQVHPDRRQDRAEPRPRPRSDLRADQAPGLPRQHLDAGQRRRTCSSKVGRAGRADRVEHARSSAGTITRSTRQRIRNYTAKPIDVEIRRTFARPRRLPQPARSRSCTTTRRSSSRRRSQPARRPTCCTRSSSTKAATPSRTT